MMKGFIGILLLQWRLCTTFMLAPQSSPRPLDSVVRSFASRGSGSRDDPPPEAPRGSSRLFGNQRAPTLQEVQIMDEMIDKLAMAKPYELPNAVQRAFRVISSPQFFLRIATRVDTAESAEQRERLQALASNLVSTVEAVVSTTTDKLDERARQVQQIVAAAAEPGSGEFLVPLADDRLAAMRNALTRLHPADLDQGFLLTVDAWIDKSHKDGLDGMVAILQQLLQMYAGLAVRRSRQEAAASADSDPDVVEVVDQLLDMDAEQWEYVMRGQPEDKLAAIVKEIQQTMESVVLRLEAGSTMQQIQAEYLQEMVRRAEAIQQGK